MMTRRQCEIAAESYAACLLAQAGYDVLVQYGPHQPKYDLVAVKDEKIMLVSVKGSQDGGWALALSEMKKGISYHQAINAWRKKQKDEVVFIFVQFMNVALGSAPRVYIARPNEIAGQMKIECGGRGSGSLAEDYKRDHPKSGYDFRIPPAWLFSQRRIDSV